MEHDTWPEYETLKKTAARFLRAWGRPSEWADDITQQTWVALQRVDATGRSAEIKSRPAYAAMVVRSVALKRIRGETRAEVGLPEDLAIDPGYDRSDSDLVLIARRELDCLSAAARSPKQRRCFEMVRAVFELLLRHYETTGEHLSFSQAYRQLAGEEESSSSQKALRYHFDKFKRAVVGAALPIKEGKK